MSVAILMRLTFVPFGKLITQTFDMMCLLNFVLLFHCTTIKLLAKNKREANTVRGEGVCPMLKMLYDGCAPC